MVKQIDYVSCPLCGMNKVLESRSRLRKGKSAILQWADFDVSVMDFIQIREGGGKTGTGKTGRGKGTGIGFPKIAGVTMSAAYGSNNTNYQNLLAQMANQLIKVVKEAKKIGLVSDADFK